MIYRDEKLISACHLVANKATLANTLTHNGLPIDVAKMLYAISGKESSFGQRREFVKYEPAYLPGGKYYRDSLELRQAYYRYGVLASSSFGAMQLMYMTAREMGFNDHPLRLQEDLISVSLALDLIQKRFIKARGATTLTQVLDAYNSGSHRDNNVPQDYIKAVLGYYNEIGSL